MIERRTIRTDYKVPVEHEKEALNKLNRIYSKDYDGLVEAVKEGNWTAKKKNGFIELSRTNRGLGHGQERIIRQLAEFAVDGSEVLFETEYGAWKYVVEDGEYTEYTRKNEWVEK